SEKIHFARLYPAHQSRLVDNLEFVLAPRVAPRHRICEAGTNSFNALFVLFQFSRRTCQEFAFGCGLNTSIVIRPVGSLDSSLGFSILNLVQCCVVQHRLLAACSTEGSVNKNRKVFVVGLARTTADGPAQFGYQSIPRVAISRVPVP